MVLKMSRDVSFGEKIKQIKQKQTSLRVRKEVKKKKGEEFFFPLPTSKRITAALLFKNNLNEGECYTKETFPLFCLP